MIVYADTNFFTNSLLDLTHSPQADALLESLRASQTAPLPVTWLLRMEFLNALQRLVFETRHGTQQLRVTPESAMLADAEFLKETEEGLLFREQALRLEDIEAVFEILARRHTAKHGFRTYDVFHVASALVLGCDTFWSFDAQAKKLAQLEGLTTN
jgi:predicted nucleic acid-binding protein